MKGTSIPITDIGSAPNYYTTPVTTSKSDWNIGVIILGCLIIGFVVAIALYLVTQNQNYPPTYPSGTKKLNVSNKTMSNFDVILPNSKVIDLSPDKSALVNLGIGQTIRVKGFYNDGSEISYERRINADPNISDLFITYDGIETNLSTSHDVKIINHSQIPIALIQKTSGGRRWLGQIIPPHSEDMLNFFYKNSTWQVVHPTREDVLISELTISGIPKEISFNGIQLKATS